MGGEERLVEMEREGEGVEEREKDWGREDWLMREGRRRDGRGKTG